MRDYQNIRPLRGKVFARVLEREIRVRPGALIILPKSMHGRASRARVTFAHPDCEVKAGDLIYFDAYKLKLVMEHGQLANAAGTPVANPGSSSASWRRTSCSWRSPMARSERAKRIRARLPKSLGIAEYAPVLDSIIDAVAAEMDDQDARLRYLLDQVFDIHKRNEWHRGPDD